jgi:peptidylprolyl isomerase
MKDRTRTIGLLGLVAAGIIAGSACKGPKYPEGIYAELNTAKGRIVLFLEYEKTPLTVTNFIGLAEGTIQNQSLPLGQKYFNGCKFHRVVLGHVIQTGMAGSTDKTGPGYSFPNEIVPGLSHDRAGVLGMANRGPHTNGSQFYITLGDRSYLDGDYTIFGHVHEGMDVVNAVAQGDLMRSVTIVRVGKKAEQFKADNKTFNVRVEAAQKRAAREEEEKRQREAALIKQNWPDVTDGAEGLKFKILQEGMGKKPAAGDVLKVIYTGQFMDGRTFVSSSDQGKPKPGSDAESFEYEVGKSQLVPGIDAALPEMRKGEKRLLILPSGLAYKTSGFYAREVKGERRFVISPDTTLVYTLELLDITGK